MTRRLTRPAARRGKRQRLWDTRDDAVHYSEVGAVEVHSDATFAPAQYSFADCAVVIWTKLGMQ